MNQGNESTQPTLGLEESTSSTGAGDTKQRRNGRRANDLTGKEWTKNSISIWSDIRKDVEENQLGHPAIYPKALVRRCLDSFTTAEQRVVLDPFSGSGSTLLAAWEADKIGIGFEINPGYVELTKRRHQQMEQVLFGVPSTAQVRVIQDDARHIVQYLGPESVDICITSPPYWDILTQRRTADSKEIRNYGDSELDLARIADYGTFVRELCNVFAAISIALRPGSYCLINVMDLRKGAVFYPFHADLARELQGVGFVWDDLIIWDRRSEYNNMRPLGFPSVFRINKAHEYILIMRKRAEAQARAEPHPR